MAAANGEKESGRHGVVAVIREADRFLVIRRSEFVKAPNLLCFPGGGIEPGEDFETALHRELMEELSMTVTFREHLWTSVTRWGTKLEWMACDRIPGSTPVPSPAEVAEVMWMHEAELLGRDDLLGSIPDFFAAVQTGVVRLQ
jgi:8-oxo-dGTP pyrophosphatase MutT (NUDIX family)